MTPDSPQNQETKLRLQLFGTFYLAYEGREVPAPRRRKTHWLLALLILRSDQAVEREWLAKTLWCDADRTNALFYLRRSLTELRKMLGDEAHRLKSPSPHILQFDTSRIECDLLRFAEALQSADRASLEQAVSLYGGELLESCQEEWVFAERNHYERQYLNALEQLASKAAARSEWSVATDWLRKLIVCEPERESAQQRLMEVLAAQGDFAAVTEAYHHFRLVLHKTLNSTPSEATTALYHRLKQQAQSVALVSALPALPLRRLPFPLTSLIGREQERCEVADLLRTVRLVTLTGSGGVGKTRLALAIAATCGKRWAQGIGWIDLAALTQETQILPTISSTLGVREQGKVPLQETLLAFLKDRQILLVMDNCEHLIKECTEVCTLLLQECPALQILATSRQPLGVSGETVRRVPSLSLPTNVSMECAALLSASEAVQLFIERARAAQQDFYLSPQNAPAVARICTMLDGIPLALEIAAVWVRSLAVEQIAERLMDRFALLMTGNRAMPTRHQTLRTLIEWSIHLLEANERELLTQLAIFAGGWTLEAAEAICVGETFQSGEVLFVLNRLAEHSLVEVKMQGQMLRYRFLETVRQYAQEQLPSADANRLLRRHCEYFADIAESLCPRLGKAETVSLSERLNADYENLRLALHTCRTVPDEDERKLSLAINLARFAHFRGSYREGIELLQDALEIRTDTASRSYREGIYELGRLFSRRGDYTTALTLCEKTHDLACAASDPLLAAEATRLAGLCLMGQDRNSEAKHNLRQALEMSRLMGGRYEEARALMSLGIVAKNEGNSAEAIDLLSQASRTFDDLGELEDAGITFHNLGNTIREQGSTDKSEHFYLKSLDIHRLLGKQAWQGVNLSELAHISLNRGDFVLARTYTEEALLLFQDDLNMTASGFHLLARIALSTGDYNQSQQWTQKSMRIQHRLGTKRNLSYSFWTMAMLAVAGDQPELAAKFLAASDTLRKEIGFALASADHADFEALTQQVRSKLSETEFAAAWEAGANLPLDAAVALALEEAAE